MQYCADPYGSTHYTGANMMQPTNYAASYGNNYGIQIPERAYSGYATNPLPYGN